MAAGISAVSFVLASQAGQELHDAGGVGAVSQASLTMVVPSGPMSAPEGSTR